MNPNVDPGSGALVFKRSPEQKAIKELREENRKLKQLLAALLNAQSDKVKSKIPEELLDIIE